MINSNAIHGVDSYLSDKCCIHAGQSASLLAFEESDAWVPRIEEFNRCTGAQVRLEYLPEGEDGMADALRADLGDDAEVEAVMGNGGQGIFDAYIVQGPWKAFNILYTYMFLFCLNIYLTITTNLTILFHSIYYRQAPTGLQWAGEPNPAHSREC